MQKTKKTESCAFVLHPERFNQTSQCEGVGRRWWDPPEKVSSMWTNDSGEEESAFVLQRPTDPEGPGRRTASSLWIDVPFGPTLPPHATVRIPHFRFWSVGCKAGRTGSACVSINGGMRGILSGACFHIPRQRRVGTAAPGAHRTHLV